MPAAPLGLGLDDFTPTSHKSSGSNFSFSRSNRSGGYSGGYGGASPSSRRPSEPITGISNGYLGQPEHGKWEYVVVDPKGLSLRSSPTYDPGQKISGKRIEEGELVTVVERISGDCTTFLHTMFPQGWCFDIQPGDTKKRVRMMEVQVQRGSWHYLILAERGVALRSRCSQAESAKCGNGPLKGALVEVTERLKAGEATFLRLKEGSWIFDMKNGNKVVRGPIDLQALPPNTMATVKAQGGVGNNCNDGILLRSSPTNQKWAATKFFLLHNSKVHATQQCEADGTCWIFVTKPGGGIEGWAPYDSVCVEATPDCIRSTAAPATQESPAQQPLAFFPPPAIDAAPPLRKELCQAADLVRAQPFFPAKQATPTAHGAAPPPAPAPAAQPASIFSRPPAPAPVPSPSPPKPAPMPLPAPSPSDRLEVVEVPFELSGGFGMPVENPALAAALAAGFSLEPSQNSKQTHGFQQRSTSLSLQEGEKPENCPRCDTTITPLNTVDGRCKNCGHRYKAVASPLRAAVAWNDTKGRGQLGQCR